MPPAHRALCAICSGPFHGRRTTTLDGQPAHAICVGRRRRPRHVSQTPRARSTQAKLFTRAFLDSQAALLEPEDFAALDARPKTWGDCRERTGPCPWVGCRHHLYLDVNPLNGSIKLNFPDIEPEELEHPCALRLAERGPQPYDEVGRRVNLTLERARQIGLRALLLLRVEAGDL